MLEPQLVELTTTGAHALHTYETLNYKENSMATCVSFAAHNELYVIDCEKVLYMQADDHYTHVYYQSGLHFMLPFGMAKVTEAIDSVLGENRFLMRFGRKFIINLLCVFHINTVKQTLILADAQGRNVSLNLPKQTLRTIMELFTPE